jgi:hypothetical protein
MGKGDSMGRHGQGQGEKSKSEGKVRDCYDLKTTVEHNVTHSIK